MAIFSLSLDGGEGMKSSEVGNKIYCEQFLYLNTSYFTYLITPYQMSNFLKLIRMEVIA